MSNGNAAQLETYSFDIFDNLKTKSVGSPVAQSWTHTVDDAHQLKQVQQTVGGTATTALLRYDDNGNLKKLCEGTGLTGTTTDCSGSATTSFTWNGLNELVALAKAGTAVLSEAYAYDDAGRRVRKTSAGVTSHHMLNGPDIVAEWSGSVITGAPTAAYVHGGATDDPVLRLTGASGTPQAVSHAFAQDGIGSVTALLSMDTEPANQMRVAGNTLTSSGDLNSTAYPVAKLADGVTSLKNPEGWVGSLGNGAAVMLNFAAPTSLERIELYAVKTSSRSYRPAAFIVEVQALSGEWRQVASGLSSDYVYYEAEIISPTNWGQVYRAIKSFPAVSANAVRIQFILTEDTQSGLVWLTELQAWSTNSSTTQRYDAWGSVAGSASIPMYGFTGREADSSGLMYNRARYYSPKYGRFISRDPIGLQGGFNPYAYAANNPVNATDPSGLLPVSPLITSGPSNYYGNGIQVGGTTTGGGLSDLSFGIADSVMVPTLISDSQTALPSYRGLGEYENAPTQQVAIAPVLALLGWGLVATEIATSDVPILGGGLGKIAARGAGVGYGSFSAFKRAEGAAGQGQAWHHIVEQTPGNVGRFGAEAIHNTANVVKLPHGSGSIHNQISGFYSSKQPFTGGLTVREWLAPQSFEEQFDFGQRALQQFGVGR